MICFPNCKINLGLYVTGKREDGYHDIATVFYPLPLRDVLEIVPAGDTTLHITGLAVAGSGTDNLVWKAFSMLKQAFPHKVRDTGIYLHKVIPMGAGLGGGSADGAFMLRLINDEYQLGLSDDKLAEYALQLGSDCPFFVYNRPRYATGRGEQMSDIAIDLSEYNIQLICPDVHVSTAAAFKMITPTAPAFDLSKLNSLPVTEWKEHIGNDFETPVFAQHPVLASVKRQLYAQGAVYAAMSGSGSAVYGIFERGKKAEIESDVSFAAFYL